MSEEPTVLEDHPLDATRVLVETRGQKEPERRSGWVLKVVEEESGDLTYLVDLDGEDRTYVPDDQLMPIDVIPMDGGVLLSNEDAELAMTACRFTHEIGEVDCGPSTDDAWNFLPSLARTLEMQLAISETDAESTEWEIPEGSDG